MKNKIKVFLSNRKEEIREEGLFFCLFFYLVSALFFPLYFPFLLLECLNDWSKQWFK